MIFLPIVERELRVASRKRSTFWVRIVAAIIALVIATGFFILTVVDTFRAVPISLGKALFATLTWLNLAAALSAGLFFTADCLSEEKREGTLGFLFLTDLRGYDVVLGKLLATSLRGSLALLAVLPILGITLLMGGVAGAQFWKTTLALVNAVFLSLTVGLFISTISRDSQKAMAGTLLMLLFLAVAGPVASAALSLVGIQPVLNLSSPVYLFREAGAVGKTWFWPSLLVNQIIAWLLFGFSCVWLPRAWQEKATRASLARTNRQRWWKLGSVKRQLRLRKKLMPVNPVLWLACRDRWQALALWLVALFLVAGLVALLAIGEDALWLMWGYPSGLLTMIVYLGVASQAGRLLVEAQRSRLIELLLVTPLSAKEIVLGQWRALLRMFALPLALYVAAQVTGAALAQKAMMAGLPVLLPAPAAVRATSNSPASTPSNAMFFSSTQMTVTATVVTGATAVSTPGSEPPVMLLMFLSVVAGGLITLSNFVALCWFGMWMGLNSKNASLATLKTIAFVQIIPWFGISFASALAVPLLLLPKLINSGTTKMGQMMIWYPLLTTGIATILYLAKNIAFSLWARRKLYSDFRVRAVEGIAPIRPALPPRLPPPISPAPAAVSAPEALG